VAETPDEGMRDLVPSEQHTVPFYGQPLLAVRLADGRIAVILRRLCERMGLATNAQIERIKRTEAIADELMTVRVETEGGPQRMPALALRALPFWLAGISTRAVSAEIRPVILAFQREVVDVLYQYFAERRAAAPAVVPAEPARPMAPAMDAPPDAWIRYHEQMLIWHRWQASVEQRFEELEGWRGTVESRLEGLEEVHRLIPEILDRMGPEPLSPAHQRTVQNAVRRLHELTGLSYGAIYDELKDAFHVSKYSEIPESRWPEVALWFKARIARAQQG
jgi:hypothetical protein